VSWFNYFFHPYGVGHAEKFDSLDDRSLAIVGAVMVDDKLERALRHRLHENKKIEEQVFRNSGPLGSFAAKIDLGLLVGLYSEQSHRDLSYLRQVRNVFAHEIHIESFDNQRVQALCNNIKVVETHIRDISPEEKENSASDRLILREKNLEDRLRKPRYRFLLAVNFFVVALTASLVKRDPFIPVQKF
jgi:hypothetical protein